MASKQHILFDKTELVLVIVEKNGARTMNVTYDKIMSISIEPCQEKKLFKTIDSEQIIIKLKATPQQPIIYKKSAEKDFFDDYKKQLTDFAKNNKISFSDSTAN